eukprot:gnl/Trimastix_PCT/1915.p1 GENE.gnl/Trimastix_PCT/1915~~gnl/Trimastix_PCT/1915.p1  ORF type:complete len:220 (+),score=24.04 gnl/Trimastix_PCT/1915:83-742(+)
MSQRPALAHLPTKNQHKEFCGIPTLKANMANQHRQFSQWAAHKRWSHFHSNHYDWWTYPISLRSSFGLKYSVFQEEVDELKTDPLYMQQYRECVQLGCLAWGWDLANDRPVAAPGSQQHYTGWDVRLRKMGLSLSLFGQEDLFDKVQRMVQYWHKRGTRFRDETSQFRGAWPFQNAAAKPRARSRSPPAGTAPSPPPPPPPPPPQAQAPRPQEQAQAQP